MKNIKKIALVLLATLMLFTSTGVNVLAEDDGIKPDVPAEAEGPQGQQGRPL